MLVNMDMFGAAGNGGINEIVYPDVSTTYSGTAMLNMFDGDDSTWWIGNAITSYVYLYNLSKQKISKINFRPGNYQGSDVNMTVTIKGSNTSISSDLVTITSFNAKWSDGVKEIPINSDYKYYVIEIVGSSSAFGSCSRLFFS